MAIPVAAGAALTGVGNLIGAGAGASAARRQNRVLAEGQRQQNRAGMESAGAVGDFITRMRQSAPNPAMEQGAFTAALGGPSIGGPGGAQFRADARDVTAGARSDGRDLASLFARIRAPQLQRQGESEMFMDLGNTLRPIGLRAEDEAFLTNLRAGMKQPNPWAGMLGAGLSNWGNAMIASGRGPGAKLAPNSLVDAPIVGANSIPRGLA